jgi:hypothetical protein
MKESVIGAEIFGRRPDYNPKTDAIVRTEARRLRALLNEYYLGDGKGDALVIDLPKGAYTPTFRQPETPQSTTAHGGALALSGKRSWLVAAMASVAFACAAGGWWQFHDPNAPVPIAVLPLST